MPQLQQLPSQKKKNGADYDFFSQPQYAVKLFDYKLYPK